MNLIALVAFLLTLVGWVLLGLTGTHLLSGYLEERTCQTDCVQSLFFSAVGAGIGGLVFSVIGVLRPHGRFLSVTSLLLAIALCGIFAVLFITGNLA